MHLCHSWDKRPIKLSPNKRYIPEEIRELCQKVTPPFWLHVENVDIAITGEDCLSLACQAAAAHHNWVAYDAPEEDGFSADMQRREAAIQRHMEEPSSDESDANLDDD
jgi:hypothetical protein